MSDLVETIIVGNDNLLQEGLRHALCDTRFRPKFMNWKSVESGVGVGVDPLLFLVIARDRDEMLHQVSGLQLRFAGARIVVLIDQSCRDCVLGLFDNGAHAVLSIGISPAGLRKSLEALVADDVLIVAAGLMTFPRNQGETSRPSIDPVATREVRRLSSREVAILERIVKGDSNKLIARHFAIAEATVKTHVKAILHKIGVANRTQAAIWSMNSQDPRTSEIQGISSGLNVEFAGVNYDGDKIFRRLDA
jgi:two-component system, NarL family, nitrate/nitrite response regulator NarL